MNVQLKLSILCYFYKIILKYIDVLITYFSLLLLLAILIHLQLLKRQILKTKIIRPKRLILQKIIDSLLWRPGNNELRITTKIFYKLKKRG